MQTIKKQFTFVLPDEPYKQTTKKKLTVNATYDGPQYLVCRVNDSTKIVEGVIIASDSKDTTNLVSEEGYSNLVIDAMLNPLEASYLSGNYTHDEIPDPTFTNPDGSTWTYHYMDGTGGINQIYFMHTLKYVGGKFIGPEYRYHATTMAEVVKTSLVLAGNVRESLAKRTYTAEERTKLEEYATWLENLETTYKGVDHWKIPFPSDIPSF
jgi:hypothetical protein